MDSDEKAVYMLAKAANGSLRDSLSLLDTAIPFCNGEFTEKNIALLLGGTTF
ncbi:hypothetical protein [Marinomonas algicola]|uniref:hypothetical protein n=1 Tax=Marinomonas algicola TaxID=2773454 RepID=UPI003B847FCC